MTSAVPREKGRGAGQSEVQGKSKMQGKAMKKRKKMTQEGEDDTNTNTEDIASDADGEWVSEEEADSVDNRH